MKRGTEPLNKDKILKILFPDNKAMFDKYKTEFNDSLQQSDDSG